MNTQILKDNTVEALKYTESIESVYNSTVLYFISIIRKKSIDSQINYIETT